MSSEYHSPIKKEPRVPTEVMDSRVGAGKIQGELGTSRHTRK